MLSRTKETQMDKATNVMRDVARYANQVARDERLRADFRAVLDHGSQASDRLKKDLREGSIYTRLATDKKLRKSIRAMLDDIEQAGTRMRPRESHRLRNALLLLAGAIAAALAFPRVRPWIAEQTGDIFGTGDPEPDPALEMT